jgi:phosphatidate cytidylyltransferase
VKQRIGSTLALWSVAILVVWLLGIDGGVLLLIALGLAAQAELYALLRRIGHPPQTRLGVGLGAAVLVGAFYFPAESEIEAFGIASSIFGLCIVALSLILLLRHVDRRQAANFMATLFGLVYVPYMLHFYLLMGRHYLFDERPDHAISVVLWVLVTAKFSDVGGLLIGKYLGRRPFAPNMSPAKTWEGVAGGVVFSLAVGLAFWFVLKEGFQVVPGGFAWWEALVIAAPLSLVAVASDLIESLLKRQAGVKDSGDYIPGIGGALDLCDSIILAAPVSYALLRLLVF